MWQVVVCRILTGRVTRYAHRSHEDACRHAMRRKGRLVRVWVEPDPSYMHLYAESPAVDQLSLDRLADDGCPNVE